MNWQKEGEEILDRIKSYREDSDGWKKCQDSKEVTVWSKRSPDWDGLLYKAEGTMDSDPETVFNYIDPTPDGPRAKWDKAIKQLEIIEKIDQDLSVVRTITHNAFGGIISSRDFTDLVINSRDDASISTNARGIEHPKCLPSKEHVRGINYPCSIICHRIPKEPNKTKVASYIQTDLGGMLPTKVVENALPSNMVDFFTCLKKQLQEDGKWMGSMNGAV